MVLDISLLSAIIWMMRSWDQNQL